MLVSGPLEIFRDFSLNAAMNRPFGARIGPVRPCCE